MKLAFGQLFKAGLAVGLGYELGRVGMMTLTRVLDKKFRQDVRTQYRQRMHIVRNETPTTGA